MTSVARVYCSWRPKNQKSYKLVCAIFKIGTTTRSNLLSTSAVLAQPTPLLHHTASVCTEDCILWPSQPTISPPIQYNQIKYKSFHCLFVPLISNYNHDHFKKKASNSKSKTRHTDYFSEVWFKLVLVLSLDFINRKPYYLLQTTFSCQDQSSQSLVQSSSVVEYTEAYT